jgi:hypothetical protein
MSLIHPPHYRASALWPYGPTAFFWFNPQTTETVAKLSSEDYTHWVAYPFFTGRAPSIFLPDMVPGSLLYPVLLDNAPGLLGALPRDLLEAELDLALNHHESLPMTTLDIMQRLAGMRVKLAQGTLSDEELREALTLLRQERIGAAAASTKSREAKAPVDLNAILTMFTTPGGAPK